MQHLGHRDRPQENGLLGSIAGGRPQGTTPFCEDGLQYATTITKRIQVANSMNPSMLEARDLSDDQARLGDANVDKRLDLEAVAPEPTVTVRSRGRRGVEIQNWQVPPPEDIEPVTEIRVASVVARVEESS